jgi:excinuclease ABC subunit B
MQRAISETQRRRAVQQAYNLEHGIDPKTIIKAVTDILSMLRPDDESAPMPGRDRRSRRRDRMASDFAELPRDELDRLIRTLEEEMHLAAAELRFEYAARLRDEISDLKRELSEAGAGKKGAGADTSPARGRGSARRTSVRS